MREKIMTLTVCITLVYWLGGLAGCATSPRDAQNEDMLKEDKSIFDTSPPAGGGNQFQTQSHPHVNVMLAAMQPAETVTEVVDVPVEIATAPAAPVNDTGISVTGIDRSSWQKIDVSPRYGRVKHSSTYFSDQPGRVYTHTTVNLDEGNEAAMEAALDDNTRHTFKTREWKSSLIQPLKFCWDLFTLPYNATVKEPFWQDPYADQATGEMTVADEAVVEAETTTAE